MNRRSFFKIGSAASVGLVLVAHGKPGHGGTRTSQPPCRYRGHEIVKVEAGGVICIPARFQLRFPITVVRVSASAGSDEWLALCDESWAAELYRQHPERCTLLSAHSSRRISLGAVIHHHLGWRPGATVALIGMGRYIELCSPDVITEILTARPKSAPLSASGAKSTI